jgi:hypothetical protein
MPSRPKTCAMCQKRVAGPTNQYIHATEKHFPHGTAYNGTNCPVCNLFFANRTDAVDHFVANHFH